MSDTISQGGALMQVRDLHVQFGKLTAVDHVSFDLRGGMLLGLLGPNGAGKTTLLRAMACLQAATGEIRVMNERVRPGEVELLRHIGFTPDNPPVYEDLTVRDFLRFIARGYDIVGSEVDERIDFWLEKVWLTEKAGQKIKGLSRGMRQRIGIARTLLANPAIVLLDEPAAGLDPAGRVQFRQLLASLREQGKALVVSSHILSDMNEYCSHVGIMSAGRMVQFGTVAEIASHVDATRCRYTVTLAGATGDVKQVLSRIEGADHIQVNHETFSLEYSSNRQDASQLLKRLIDLGLPVAAFTAHQVDLEEAYLRTGIRQVD